MAWVTIPQISEFGTLMTDRLLAALVGNLAHIRTPPQYTYTADPALSAFSITSTSFVELDNVNQNFRTTQLFTGNPVEISLYAGRVTVSGGVLVVSANVDGSDIGMPPSWGLAYAAVNSPLTLRWVINPAAGSHTIYMTVRMTAGTGTLYPAHGMQFRVREL